MDFRDAVSMFLGAIAGVFAWLAWIVVALLVISGVIGIVSGGADPRAAWSPALSYTVSALLIVFLFALPAFISARMGARVAARRTGSAQVARLAFLMALGMEIILVMAFAFLFLAGGA
ncbi:MAG: hypothetical protein HYX95_00625 [Chloroflexi bacterium]|nr:hypothetical protein [Chloroflexota bacterium]